MMKLSEPIEGVVARNAPVSTSELDSYMNRTFLITSNNSMTGFNGVVGRFYTCFDNAVYNVIGDKPATVSPELRWCIDGVIFVRILYDGYYNDFVMRMLSNEGELHRDEIKADEYAHIDHPEWFEKITL